jgi:hypothetical protein
VWASGKTLEECRRNLAEVVDGWVLVRLARGLPIPPLGDVTLAPPREMSVAYSKLLKPDPRHGRGDSKLSKPDPKDAFRIRMAP